MTHTTEHLEPFTKNPRPHRSGKDLALVVYADPGMNSFYYRDRKPDSVAKYVRDDIFTAELIAARKRIAELDGALRALMELNDNHGPFGGEMYQDRIDRTWDRARATLEPKT